MASPWRWIPLLLALAATTALASVSLPAGADTATARLQESPRHGEWVDVALPGSATPIRTYVVFPERADPAPVVLVIHEIFGLTDWVRGVADQLAADGYIALAPDLLSGEGPGGGGTDSFAGDKVREAIRALTPARVNERLDAVRAHGLGLPAAAPRSAVIGFCWGGTAVWNYAVHQPELTAGVVYYGTGPADRAAYGRIRAPLAAFYGGDDARVNATIPASVEAMEAVGGRFTPATYPGAGHGFLRQQTGREGANLRASEAAWPATLAFLRQHLGT